MDPRERLKRYLEQRKELGERELVLDGMTVDEVMNIVGAAGAGTAPRSGGARKGDLGRTSPAPGQDTPVAASNQPSAMAAQPERPATDWREALRASGAAPEPKTATREAKDAPRAPAEPPAAPRPPAPASPATPTPAPPASPPASKRYEFPRPVDTTPDDHIPGSSPAQPARGSSSTGEASPPSAHPESRAGTTTGAAAGVPGIDAPTGLVVGSASRDLFGTSVGKLGSLTEIAEVVAGCQRCPLYSTATNPVPGEGSPTAELVCVGEAPGANEDATGRPFVGQSGELLTKILGAISLKREDVFICNVLKHRPPGNRNPLPEEVVACSPYLVQQLELIRPKVIVAFGTFAAQTLLNTRLPIGKLRGAVHRYHGVPLIVTYHPAALLRNPAWKRPTWENVQLARRILDTAPRA